MITSDEIFKTPTDGDIGRRTTSARLVGSPHFDLAEGVYRCEIAVYDNATSVRVGGYFREFSLAALVAKEAGFAAAVDTIQSAIEQCEVDELDTLNTALSPVPAFTVS